ncbi:MAG TPA: hypothetical protein GXZ52_02555 [Clostridiales bacterium]|nr:hypothetical protein [Clostridiales bacterium]
MAGLSVLLVSILLITGALYEHIEDQVFTELRVKAAYIIRGIENMGMAYFEDLPPDSRITWVDTDGNVLYDSEADSAAMESHSDREEIIEALSRGQGEAVRYSETMAEKTIYVARRLSRA